MLTDNCVDRLWNFKFLAARERLTSEATEQERELVEALATTFGNPGWFVGGELQKVIAAAIRSVASQERWAAASTNLKAQN